MNNIARFRALIIVLLIVVVLSSCMRMTSHLFTVRKQVCEFDDNFSVQFNQRVEVKMKNPVLLEREALMLIGAPPTYRTVTAEGMTARYVFEQIQASSEDQGSLTDEEFAIDLLFVSSDNDFLLSGIRTSEVPPELHDSALHAISNIPDMAQQACDIQFNLLSLSTEVEIDRDTLDLLPVRQTIIAWLGPPLVSSDSVSDLDYRFRLKGKDNDLTVAQVSADYDQAGEYPTLINASFSRYQAVVDVPAGTMRVKLD